jgi:Na+-transporting NADH:ubiquinone oxidoreductase subunit NqrD
VAPIPEGSILVHTVTFKTVIDMDASSFDSRAYIANLAAGLDGVTADQISVTVSGGSLLLTTVITTPTLSVARSTEQFIGTSTAQSLSAVVGVTITNLEAPTRATAIAVPPSPADNTALIIGLAVGISALVLVIIGIVVVMKRQGTKAQTKVSNKMSTSTTATA